MKLTKSIKQKIKAYVAKENDVDISDVRFYRDPEDYPQERILVKYKKNGIYLYAGDVKTIAKELGEEI